MLSLHQQEDCFSNIIQDFLICTTIHKARQLGVFQGETFVRVALGGMTRHTKVFANSENPYFNEYFVFEIKCTLGELLRLTILYEVKRRTTCKKNPTLGELLIDMQSVWQQRNRCYFKKWGRLEASIEQRHEPMTAGGIKDLNESSKGFLQIDLAIVSQATNTHTLLRPYEDEVDVMSMNVWQINHDYDDIEKNLLDNIDTETRCNIRYTVTFYRGIMSKKSDYIIQFRFHPFRGKTTVAKNTQNPVWNQEINFAWIYPSLAQTLVIQLMAHQQLQWKCVAEYEIHFEEIAFKDKPSLGPTFVHLYDNLHNRQYVGRLLMEIQSECLESVPQRHLKLKVIPPLDEKRYWDEEAFVVEFLALQGDFFHGNISNCKLHMKLAENISNNLECFLKSYDMKKSQSVGYPLKYFRQEAPYKAITLRLQFPDNRQKYESEMFLHEVVADVKQELERFKQFQVQYAKQLQAQLKVLRDIISRIVDVIKDALETQRLEHGGPKEPTAWDVKRILYLQNYFVELLELLKNLRSKPKPFDDGLQLSHAIEEVLRDLWKVLHNLQNLCTLHRLQDDWPDLLLFFCIGNKETGVCRLDAKRFLYPYKDRDQRRSGGQCWKVRNFVFKDIHCQHTCTNCGCTVAIILGCLNIVRETERTDFINKVQNNWDTSEPFYWSLRIPYTTYKCRIFIHQAKIRPGADRSGLCDPYVRVVIGLNSAETHVQYSTLSPIWNTVITFNGIKLPGDFQWYNGAGGGGDPPLVVLELYDTDKKTTDDYLGSGSLPLGVISTEEIHSQPGGQGEMEMKPWKNQHALEKYEALKYVSPPPLKWVAISLSGAIRAEILMSGELIAMNAESEKGVQNQMEVTMGIPSSIRPNMRNYVLEIVFAGFRNYTKATLFSGRHRVKVMMADLLLTSGLSASRLKHSINFLVAYASGIVSLPDQCEYWPALIATDVVVSSKDQETTVGAVLIPDTRRYLQQHKELTCNDLSPGEESDLETSIASTTVNISQDQEDDTEIKPLLKKSPKLSLWQRLTSKPLKQSNEISASAPEYSPTFTEVMDEKEFNWWTKFYNSGLAEPCGPLSHFKHKLCIYQSELEKQPEFSQLTDWAEPWPLVHGVKYKKNSLPKEEVYAILKMHIKITPCLCNRSQIEDGAMLKPLATALNPRYQAQMNSMAELTKIVVRVYIVQGLQFRPGAKNAQADSYVRLQLGQKVVTNRANYVANESNPVFGKCFQLEGLLPREHVLEISVFNRNSLHDEPIGSTHIDLEDRWRSKHRATVGLANEFSSFGYNKWRDSQMPSQILKELCEKNGLRQPRFKNNTIEIDGVALEDETEIATGEDLQERLSLTALKNFPNLPSFGFRLIPEHVETRSLYRPDCPGLEQGKIQLWLELYDGNVNIPPAIDITPQPPQIYELRIVIFGVSDVVLDETNIFGSSMSDIYVKGWCSNPDESQTTDIHYRSLNGEGKFNWRMIFPLKYSSIEDMMVSKRKSGLMEEYHIKQPPKLSLQIWDDDIISQDDFLGTLEINLSNFPQPYETAKKCQLTSQENLMETLGRQKAKNKSKQDVKLLNIFRQKKVRGWFPARGNVRANGNQTGLAGKIELELEVLTEKEAALYPVGLGRNPPNALPEPIRPATSFNPFTSPWRGFKHILAPNLLKYLLIVGLLVLVGFGIFLFIINFPLIMASWNIGF